MIKEKKKKILKLSRHTLCKKIMSFCRITAIFEYFLNFSGWLMKQMHSEIYNWILKFKTY